MFDTRFTTIAKDMSELITALDVDDVGDIETLLIVLFRCPITVEELSDDDDDASFEVIAWNDDMGIGTRFAFPLSMVDLALGFELTVSDLRSTEDDEPHDDRADDDEPDEDTDVPDLQAMDEGELITTLQRALGQVRIYNMLHKSDEA